MAVATLLAALLPAVASGQVEVTISGLHSRSEGACSQATVFIVGSDCTYTAQRPGDAFFGWSGPAFGGGYYAAGSAGDSVGYTPVPGDAKIQPTISGTLVITGTGPDATIEGTFVVGAAVRNTIVGNLTRGVERWDALTHTLAPTAVTTATANGNGGFDYVIGANGLPGALCLTADPAQCFPAESGADPALSDFQNVWNNDVPPVVGIERTPLMGGPAPNIGAVTTGVFTNYSSSCANAADCETGRIVWGATSPTANTEDPGWDNLILAISTDAAGNITSGTGWWTQEYALALGPPAQRTVPNSWQASRFSFAGAAVGAGEACASFREEVIGGSADNAIDAASRCTGFEAAPAITIVTAPANGVAVVGPAGTILYTPDRGFSGDDSLTYRGTAGAQQATGVLTIGVGPDPVPVVTDAALDTGVAATVALTVTLGNGAAADHSLTVIADGANGSCSTTITGAGAFTVSYAADPGFVGNDLCTVEVSDANGDSDTAIVSITVPDVIVVGINGGGSGTGPWLAGLLAVLAARVRRRRVATTAAVALLAGPAVAADGSPAGATAPAVPSLYAGVALVGTSFRSDERPGPAIGLGEGVRGSFSDFSGGASVYAGFNWSRVAGVELRYADSGSASSRLTAQSDITGDSAYLGRIEADLAGYTLYLTRVIPDLPLPPSLTLYGKAGWTWQELDLDFTPSGIEGAPSAASGSDRDNGVAVAVGLRWRVARHWALAAEGEYLWVNFDNVLDEPWRIGLGIEFGFGKGRE